MDPCLSPPTRKIDMMVLPLGNGVGGREDGGGTATDDGGLYLDAVT